MMILLIVKQQCYFRKQKNMVDDQVFTDSALWARSDIESQCPSVCVCFCAIAKHPLPGVVEISGLISVLKTKMSPKLIFQ